MRLGDIAFVDAAGPVLAFTREHDGARMLCVFNMSADEAVFSGDMGEAVLQSGAVGGAGALGPYAVHIGKL